MSRNGEFVRAIAFILPFRETRSVLRKFASVVNPPFPEKDSYGAKYEDSQLRSGRIHINVEG
jgi:hypothetical protein